MYSKKRTITHIVRAYTATVGQTQHRVYIEFVLCVSLFGRCVQTTQHCLSYIDRIVVSGGSL